MGQSSSAERQPESRSAPASATPPTAYEVLEDGQRQGPQEQQRLLATQDRRWSGLRNGSTSLSRRVSGRPRPSEHYSTYRRETRARSTFIDGIPGIQDFESHGRDDVVLEQEERPLILRDMEVRLNDAPITDIQAAPMPRRGSVLSRLGSRVMSRNPQRAAQQRTGRESEEMLVGIINAEDAVRAQPISPPQRSRRNRYSMFDMSTRSALAAAITEAPRRNSLSGTAPSELPADSEVHHRSTDRELRDEPPSGAVTSTPEPPSRGSRLRRTLTNNFADIFHRNQGRATRSRNTTYSHAQPGSEDTRNLISPQGTGTTAIDPAASSAHLYDAEEGTESNPVELDSPDRPTSWLPSSRDSDNGTDSRRSSRRVQQLLGGRSSRLIRREDDTPLSRVLQLAAAAIAAQLSGFSDSSPDLQSVGDDHFDGNLNAFIQSLNNAAEQRVNDESDSSNANLPPLNFWRVFRFVNNHNRDPGAGLNNHPPEGESTNGRLVTLVVVGVRSVPSSSVLSDTAGTLNTNLDGLLALSTSPPDGLPLVQGSPSPPTNSRNRLQRRRTSLTGTNPFPSQYESQRHQGTNIRLNRNSGVNSLRRTPTATSFDAHARPPSPFPGANNTTSSSFGNAQAHDERTTHTPTSPTSPNPDATSTRRQRRRSESHGFLGSGAARRNGVVEPDRDSNATDTMGSPNGRHWLIYVVGTNLSEDHPAFQAPSLFTDNPSYEDMVMLSTLLGPVKPPVATAEEVAAARGIFRLEIQRADGAWTARALDNPAGHGVASPLDVLSADVVNCLVCQDDFKTGDEVRQLAKCKHVYHRQCVDEWLTTGRNSCPMCRTPGVEEFAQSSPATAE